MSNIIPLGDTSPFDAIRKYRADGSEYWVARELMVLMGYTRYQRFEMAIKTAIENVELNGDIAINHFCRLTIKSLGRDAEDFKMTRYAAYMTALCCDSRKPEVAAAKRYFAMKCVIADAFIYSVTGNMPTAFGVGQNNISVDKSGFVYLLSAGSTDKYKIGYSKNVYKRAQNIQISSPFEVKVIHRIFTVDAPALESKLHDYYDAYRIRGEWFELTPAHIKEFVSVANSLDEDIELNNLQLVGICHTASQVNQRERQQWESR